MNTGHYCFRRETMALTERLYKEQLDMEVGTKMILSLF
jgi:hypothetical protein